MCLPDDLLTLSILQTVLIPWQCNDYARGNIDVVTNKLITAIGKYNAIL